MEKYAFETPLGDIWLWGEPDALRGDRPIVLFINGAFSIPRPRSFDLQGLMPEAAVFNAHLPGNHSPWLVAQSVGVFAAAFSSVLDELGRPAVVVGASAGALVAMAMRSAHLRGLVLVEPILRTGKLWPLVPSLRERLAEQPDDAALRAFIWAVFGVSETALEDRDYRDLAAKLSVPSWAVFGGEPLYPERPVERLPSLVDEPERDLFRNRADVRTEVIATVGHNVPGYAINFLRGHTRDLLARCGLTREGSA